MLKWVLSMILLNFYFLIVMLLVDVKYGIEVFFLDVFGVKFLFFFILFKCFFFVDDWVFMFLFGVLNDYYRII